ncbi:SPW repeat domain-containing protein [Saccharothrix sp. NRRL B-16314]|uniref:SPW repeat domain-containing protein n=1 Tax=Saccharothrix sp. NRRL B-16314 TaxID=1463825 RepID=UPI0012DFD637|nr:SPW repeat protein [Saccharothrix sp. NRRL B-16314]
MPEARREPVERPAPRGEVATTVGVVVSFLAGLWLIMAPFALDYRTAADAPPHWNSVYVGFAVAVCSLVHAMAPRETPWLGPVLLAVGGWLVVVVFAGHHPAGTRAAVNDVVTGAVVVAVALGSIVRTAFLARRS